MDRIVRKIILSGSQGQKKFSLSRFVCVTAPLPDEHSDGVCEQIGVIEATEQRLVVRPVYNTTIQCMILYSVNERPDQCSTVTKVKE